MMVLETPGQDTQEWPCLTRLVTAEPQSCLTSWALSCLLALKYHCVISDFYTDLNVGMGDPCTGQLKLCDNELLTVTRGGTRLDNFGPDPPIGSGIVHIFFRMHYLCFGIP